MYAIRKSDLVAFTPRAQDVCRIEEGSTNSYLRDERAIEEFLKTVEPNYNTAIHKLTSQEMDQQTIYTLAAFAAYVSSCSPAGMRIRCEPLKNGIIATAALMDYQNKLPKAPPILGGKTLSELLESGDVRPVIDPKYSQAIGINIVLNITSAFGNSHWDIFHNDFPDTPFFSSDFPVAIERDPSMVLNRIVPLTPQIAIRICPSPMLNAKQLDFHFTSFTCKHQKATRNEVRKLNCAIVRCAEDSIFYREDHSWIKPFIRRNRNYRIEPYSIRRPTDRGEIFIASSRIAAIDPKRDVQ